MTNCESNCALKNNKTKSNYSEMSGKDKNNCSNLKVYFGALCWLLMAELLVDIKLGF